MEELSRLVLGVHEEVQREMRERARDTSAPKKGSAEGSGSVAEAVAVAGSGADVGADGLDVDRDCPGSFQPGPSSAGALPDAQPFILPLGVMARNEDYPRTCRQR